MFVMGIGIIIGGLTFSGLFLRLAYTDKWATPSAISIMHYYCVYCMFMGINGITEAYVYAKAD